MMLDEGRGGGAEEGACLILSYLMVK